MIAKSEVLTAVCTQLQHDLERMVAAARAVEEAATDSESRSEGKYDTRGLEASYLAAGQGEQVDALVNSLRLMQVVANFPDLQRHENAQAGALVEVELAGERLFFLLAPAAGGIEVDVGGNEVTVLAPGSPLRGKIEGQAAGGRIADPSMKILSIC